VISTLKHLQHFWYVASFAKDLRHAPIACRIADHPVVLFRDSLGGAHALLDRCCHRDMPLSAGKITPQGIQCGYHGWEFSPQGQCVRIPGQPADSKSVLRGCVASFVVLEQDGLLWVYGVPNEQPVGQPLRIPYTSDPSYGTVLLDFGAMNAALDNILDNFMDSLHPPFIHAGLIYDDKKRNRLTIDVRHYKHRDGFCGVEGGYLNEPPPIQGLIGRLFAQRTAATVLHEERYIAPTLMQVEFRIGKSQHLLSTQLFTPETPTRTRMRVMLNTKSKLPMFITNFILRRLFTKLFKQDIQALELQQKAIDQTGVLPRASSDMDILSLISVHFLNQVAEGKPLDAIHVQEQQYDALI
jgi:phenylpropionate dioxygenase-like ring-hydroxylating dioxygenase large terminal subunit